jgi:hypothetical protein
MLITTVDGYMLDKAFNGTNKYNKYYTVENGN